MRVLIAVLLLAAACTANAEAYDCKSGCSLKGSTGACGANGVTYINDCLAVCSGTAVAYQGPCTARAAAADGTIAAAAAAAAAPLTAHPIGRFFAVDSDGQGVTADSAGGALRQAPAAATVDDISRFSHEGLVLAGPARQGSFKVAKPDSVPIAKAAAGEQPQPARVVRVMLAEGLVYVSAAPLDAGTAQQQFFSGSRPTTARAPAPASSGGSASPLVGKGSSAKTLYPINPRDWDEVQSPELYPYTAIGSVEMDMGMCSGSLFGNYAVITAAHCVYERYLSETTKWARFTPHRYYDQQDKLQMPFGSATAKSVDFLSGWADKDESTADLNDMAVILLEKDLGSQTGTLGLANVPGGFKGRIYAAGYPGETPSPWGRYYKLKGVCKVEDANGNDNVLELKTPGAQRTCLTRCAISEAGQSGQPAYIKTGDTYSVLAVLNSGPPTGTCKGWDLYHEISGANLKWLGAYTKWQPTAN